MYNVKDIMPGRRLRLAIIELGMTQKDFAQSIHYDTSTVCNIIYGRLVMSQAFARIVSLAYPQYSEEWLLHGDGDEE